MSKSNKGSNNNVGMSLRHVSEGQLLKYTNMIQGWQNRWFVLDPHTGILEYFMTEGEKKHRPRATLHLAGAIVVPSEEDSYTFTVNGANDDSFKLRAVDAKERQYWINRLRVVAQAHTQVLAESNPPLVRDHSQLSGVLSTASAVSSSSPYQQQTPSQRILSCNLTVLDAFSSVRDYLRRVECEHQRLIHDIEDLPSSSSSATCTDTELLILKATSQATLLCLEQCLAILHYQQQQPNSKNKIAGSAANSPLLVHTNKASIESKRSTDFSRPRSESAVSALSDLALSGPSIDTGNWSADNSVEENASNDARTMGPDDEATYVPVDPVPARTGQQQQVLDEEYKVRTLKLLSQLKLGTELTRVNLPVFFCESRSLLQVLADAFRQPQLLLKLSDEKELSSEQRMAKVIQWYLGCIRACQLEMTAARKPLNPILGETFKCIYHFKDEKSGDVLVFRFQAEQVSHNPPISAFHFECPQKGIQLTGNLSIKAKFMGMYASATLGGEVALELTSSSAEPPERYEMSYPTLYLRSFLSEPWMEFGGKIQVQCTTTRVTAGLVFQTKPFYGGKPHQVTAEIKSPSGNGRISGDWMNGALELTWASGQTDTIPGIPTDWDWPEQKIRPLASQCENESLKLWRHVRQALSVADTQTAGEYKKQVEERQREKERKRVEQGIQHLALHFVNESDTWFWKKK